MVSPKQSWFIPLMSQHISKIRFHLKSVMNNRLRGHPLQKVLNVGQEQALLARMVRETFQAEGALELDTEKGLFQWEEWPCQEAEAGCTNVFQRPSGGGRPPPVGAALGASLEGLNSTVWAWELMKEVMLGFGKTF